MSNTVKNLRHGEKVKLIVQNEISHKKRRGGLIKVGTLGKIIALRDHNGKRQYLVKFVGVGTARHCNEDQIERFEPKEEMSYKIVLSPIRVPKGKYCWEWKEFTGKYCICHHYDTDGRANECRLGFLISDEASQLDGAEGIEKPIECRKLEEKG